MGGSGEPWLKRASTEHKQGGNKGRDGGWSRRSAVPSLHTHSSEAEVADEEISPAVWP